MVVLRIKVDDTAVLKMYTIVHIVTSILNLTGCSDKEDRKSFRND